MCDVSLRIKRTFALSLPLQVEELCGGRHAVGVMKGQSVGRYRTHIQTLHT